MGRGRRSFALVLGCLCPFTANYTATPLTETLTLASIAAAFFSLDRWRRGPGLRNVWVLAIGAALAVSLLLRPEQALLSVAVLPAMALVCWRHRGALGSTRPWQRAFAPVAAAALCVVLPLIPWSARNWRTFHRLPATCPTLCDRPWRADSARLPTLVPHLGCRLCVNRRGLLELRRHAIAMSDLPARAFDSPEQRAATEQLLADYNATTSPTAALDARFAAIAQQSKQHSLVRYYVFLPAARLANMLLRPRTELTGIQLAWWRWHDSPAQTLFATAYAGLNLVYLVLAGAGWWRWRRLASGSESVLLWSMAAFILLRCALLLTLDNSEPRYTLELFPILVVCAAALWRKPAADLIGSSSSLS